MHQRAGANYQNRKRSISVAGRCITRIEPRAESPGHEDRERNRDREREREMAARRSREAEAKPKTKPCTPPKGRFPY